MSQDTVFFRLKQYLRISHIFSQRCTNLRILNVHFYFTGCFTCFLGPYSISKFHIFFHMVGFIFQRSTFDFTGCFLPSRDISHIVSPGFFSLKKYVGFHTFFDWVESTSKFGVRSTVYFIECFTSIKVSRGFHMNFT